MLQFIKNLISILAYFFNPKVRRRREKEKMYDELKALETAYGEALNNDDPQGAATLDAKMREMREKIKYLENDE